MPPPSLRFAAVLLLVTTALAGCIGAEEPLDPASLTAEDATLSILDEAGAGVPMASLSALGATGEALAVRSADTSGTLSLAGLPVSTAEVLVTAPGHEPWQGGLDELGETLILQAAGDGSEPVDEAAPVLTFLEPVLLGTAHLADQPTTCEAYNCGASEPVIEVAGDGTIYASGTCCIGESPPIWYSQDGGETFDLLEGDVLRESYGIEGDLAVDEAGNLYFTDISVASAYISSWDADQEHRHTVPVGPFKPIVDRPWVRAGGADEVFFAYNTGTSTEFYKSTDGGLTWLPVTSFPGALGALGQGPENDHLYISIRGDLYESTDAGERWAEVEGPPAPSEEG
ncbi:MAG: carboxypeptidase-like regulatory domain-containing protein, partial [Candidatus Thermoplasmatota archaeon]|nr:carboxypeptidase-like regulatory domain-containing protein [Candidatus Thermoplasmatota archaeon]